MKSTIYIYIDTVMVMVVGGDGDGGGDGDARSLKKRCFWTIFACKNNVRTSVFSSTGIKMLLNTVCFGVFGLKYLTGNNNNNNKKKKKKKKNI